MSSISVYGYDQTMLDFDHVSDSDEISETEQDSSQALPKSFTSSPLLSLPYEIRAQIYDYLLPYTAGYHKGVVYWYRASSPIWAVNRQVYNECMPAIYGNNTFHIEIRHGDVHFLCQWLQQASHGRLYLNRAFLFPGRIALCNRALLRRFDVRVHQVDGYLGMINYNCENAEALAAHLRDQVETFCSHICELAEIRDLHISYEGGDASSRKFLDSVMEPFWSLKNTHNVIIQGSEVDATGSQAKLQKHLQDAYLQ